MESDKVHYYYKMCLNKKDRNIRSCTADPLYNDCICVCIECIFGTVKPFRADQNDVIKRLLLY